MFRAKRLGIAGIVLCVIVAVYALLPVFLPHLIPALGIPEQVFPVFFFEAGALTGFVFILSGIIICFSAGDIGTVSDFILFLYACAFCIIGKCRGYDTPGTLPGVMIVISNVSACITAYYGIRMLNSFFILTKPVKMKPFLKYAVYIPFVFLAAKYILVLSGAVALRNFPFEIAGNILLIVFFVVLPLLLNYFLKKMPRQSSLSMRTIFYSMCIAFLPFLCKMISLSFTTKISDTRVYWPPECILALLSIPAGFVCAVLQLVRNSPDSISPRMMSGCSTCIVSICICTLCPSILEHIYILVAASTILYQLLTIPLNKFLNPKLTALEFSLDSLERTAFRCSSSDNILVIVADWLISMLNPEFVAFYKKADKDNKHGKFLYCDFGKRINDREVLSFMLKERLENEALCEQRMIHRKLGFSVPMYQMHELSGFIFIGAKSENEMYSETEMSILQPVARILMESMMVLDLRKQADYVSEMQNQIVFSFADMIESRDGTTGQHIKRTSTIVSMLAKNLKEHNIYADKLMPSDYEVISLAAPLHDIGKIKVPDSILSKPGKLTDEEFETIKTHPVEGEKIISRTMVQIENERYLKLAKEMALYHHEKWNGKGYPEGLAGEDIPVSARIMAIADVFDALCSSRSYKEAFSVSQAFNILEESRGTHFEPCLVDAMKMLKPELEKIYAGA